MYGDIVGSGGYLRYCRGIFGNGVSPADMDVTFVCSKDLYDKVKPLDEKIRIVAHPWPSSPSRLKRYLWHLYVYPQIVRRAAPDVEFYPSGRLRTLFRRAITIATCHNLLLFDQNEMRRMRGRPEFAFFARYQAAQARSLQAASGVIFFSEHSRQFVHRVLPGIKRTIVISHGVDPEFLSDTERSYEIGPLVRVLYVSSVFPYKHHAEVIRAIRALRSTSGMDLRLRLVGSAPLPAYRELEHIIMAQGADAYVEMVGELSRRALMEEYRQADLFLFASSSETFGITLLEAMGGRLPIACSDRTGLPSLIRDACIYFDPENPDSIASALSQLLESSERRELLGERAYHYAREYSWKVSGERTFAFIRQICQGGTT